MTARFIPPHPPRPAPVPVLAGFFGERARNAVYGWSEAAFRELHIRRRVLRFTVHFVFDPSSVQRVLLDNVGNYAKPEIVKRLLAPMIGRGLLTSDGELWRAQRKIVAASFAPAAVDALIPTFAATARARSERWIQGMRDMAEEATATTMTVITDSLFGGDPRLKTETAMRHIEAALKAAGQTRLPAVLGLPVVDYTPTLRRGRRGQEFLRGVLADVVRGRGPDGGADDFLGRLIRALRDRFDPAEALTLAVDNAATFYLAGHETTANAVTWTLFLLSEQPELQAELADEARSGLAGGEDDPGLPDRVPRLRAALEEALRLYPPVPRMDRQAVGPDRLGEWEVARGDIVSIWPWIIHRHKLLWEEPDGFDPERFLPERRSDYHRFQYIPFGGGPRVCVGQRFATAEALTVLAPWLARWRFAPAAAREVKVVGSVTLRPDGGLPLGLEKNCY